MDLFLLTITIIMLKKPFFPAFNSSISLMQGLLKHRNPLIMDRLPPYLQQYRLLLKELCLQGDANLNLGVSQVQKVADCAHLLEKLTKNLIACSRDVGRISPYLIADILGQYEAVTLYPNVKVHIFF